MQRTKRCGRRSRRGELLFIIGLWGGGLFVLLVAGLIVVGGTVFSLFDPSPISWHTRFVRYGALPAPAEEKSEA